MNSTSRRRGIASLWTVLVIMVVVAFLAMAIDILYLTATAQQLWAGSDAGALAGARMVRRDVDLARDEAVRFAALNRSAGAPILIGRNDGNTASGDVVVGRYSRLTRQFFPIPPGTGLPNAVRVVAPRDSGSAGGPVALLLGPIFGIDTAEVTRTATAVVGGDVGPGIIALDPTEPCALTIQGHATLSVENGAVIINSAGQSAACAVGNAGTLQAAEVYVTGTAGAGFAQSLGYENELFEDSDPVLDPLAALPAPSPPSANHGNVTVSGNPSAVTQLQPGYYNELQINSGHAIMAPGVYYVDGPLKVSGDARLDGTAGVLIFVGPSGSLDLTGIGGGWVRLNPLDPMVYPDGPAVPAELQNARVTLFQARGNTGTARFRGNNNSAVTGTVYIPDGLLDVGGTASTFSNGLIADRIRVFGNSQITVDYDGRFPLLPRFVFLVE